jgi:hypothetical protein
MSGFLSEWYAEKTGSGILDPLSPLLQDVMTMVIAHNATVTGNKSLIVRLNFYQGKKKEI